jgi:hypothetical protein
MRGLRKDSALNTKGFHYDVELEVSFTIEEASALCELAKLHYDDTCRAAGMLISDGAQKNGFLARLTMFPPRSLTVNWTFDKFDLTAKILEQLPWVLRANRSKWQVLEPLTTQVLVALRVIAREYDRLNKEVETCKMK